MIEQQQAQAAAAAAAAGPGIDTNDSDSTTAPVRPTPTPTSIVIDPDIRDDATADGPAGGDPDAFEDLTGIDSDWSNNDTQQSNSAVPAPPPPIDPGIPAIPQSGGLGGFFTNTAFGRLIGRLLGFNPATVAAQAMTPTALGGSRETYEIDNPRGLDVEFSYHPTELSATVTVNGQPTDIQVEPVYSTNGEIESFRPVTTGDSDRLEELTGATVMSSEEVDKPENVNAPDVNESDNDVETVIESKIERQLRPRGWDPESVDDLIEDPDDTREVRDTRWNPDGTRRDDPATAYIDSEGNYVVRNDADGTIVQVSDKNDPDWKAPWD